MHNIKFLKTLTAGVALAVAFYPQAFADDFECPSGYDTSGGGCIKSGSDCDGNCTWIYDYKAKSITVKPNPGASGDLNIKNTYKYLELGTVQDFIIEEGITSVDRLGQSLMPLIGTGTLYIPKTLKNIAANASLFSSFTTIDSKSEYNPFNCFRCMNSSKLTKIILSPVEDAVIGSGWRENSGQITVECRGAISKCESMLQNDGRVSSIIYYKEYDTNNNLILEYTDTGYIRYDESGRILGKYNLSDKLLASYDYASDGSVYVRDGNGKLTGAKKTSPFTPAEAAALVKKGNNNTVTLTFK